MPITPDDPFNVLIVDDDSVDRMALRRVLRAAQPNVTVTEAAEADEAMAAIEPILSDKGKYNCIILDYHLPGENGLALTQKIRHQGIETPVIILTGQGDERIAVELMKAGASDYLPKRELSEQTISRAIRNAIQVYQAQQQVNAANRQLREQNALLAQKNRDLERQRHQIFTQNLQLQEASALKSRFLATMSHELRTPLNAIMGFSQILLSQTKGPLTEIQQDIINRIFANGKNQLALINDVLAFSKAEAGGIELRPSSLDLAELVRTTAEELTSLAVQKGLALEVNVALSNPTIISDAVRLRQILVNLLSNAIKFTDQGFVRIEVKEVKEQSTVPASPTLDRILIAVTDSGCGIGIDEQTYIFEAFRQAADREVVRKRAGTGLGLAITSSLVKMMQGEITLSSQINQGATFEVNLPRQISKQ